MKPAYTEERVIDEFKKCIECGACYVKCPFNLWGTNPKEKRQAVKDANSFIKGELPLTNYLKTEIFRCAECDACHRPCPVDIHRKHANMLTKRKVGLGTLGKIKAQPVRFGKLRQTAFEQTSVKKWDQKSQDWYKNMNPKQKANTLIYNGCYPASTKDDCIKFEEILTKGNNDFVTYGKFEYCCGSFGLYRGVDDLKKTNPKLKKMISTVEPKEIITNCGHCKEAMQTIVEEMGLTHINVRHPSDKILDLVKENKITLHPLTTSTTIQDSCLSGQNSEDSSVRTLLNKMMTVVESKDSKEKSKCCGDVAHLADHEGISTYNSQREKDFKSTETDHVAVYCAGCKDMYSSYDNLHTRDVLDLIHESIFST